MAAYSNFAKIYDRWMRKYIPYSRWTNRIIHILCEHNITSGLIAELGCGSCNIAIRLDDKGYDMIGIDRSPQMLAQAYEKLKKHGDILLLNQDIRTFELYGTVKAFICCCDTINYCKNTKELTKVFSLVNNYLDPGGLFIFDIKTPFWYGLTDGLTDARHEEKGDFYCETCLDEDEFEYHLTMFEKNENNSYEKYEEYHYQHVFSVDEVKSALDCAHLKLIGTYDAYTTRRVKPDSDRICFIAKEYEKNEQ